MAVAQRDSNYVPSLIGVSSSDQVTPTLLEVDPATGRLLVNATVTGGGSGGTSSTDDSAFSAASGNGTPIMGFVTGDSVDSGDVGVLGMLANRQLKVTLFDSGGSELSIGGGTQYTEDAAAAANPVGNALNLIRDDSRSGSLTSTNGDNVAARGTNNGELYVKHVDAIPVTDNSGSLTVDNAGLTELEAAINSSKLDINIKSSDVSLGGGTQYTDAAATPGAPVGTLPVFDNAGTIKAVSNTLGLPVNIVASQLNLQVDINSTIQPLPIADSTNNSITSTGGGLDVNILSTTAAVPVNDNGSSLTIDSPVGAPAFVRLSDGASAISTLPVSLASVPSHAVTNAGTFAVQESGSALTALQLIDDTVFADDAAYTLSTSKGNVVSGVAVQTDGTDPTAVSAEGDAAALRTDMQRNLIVNQTHPRFWHVSADYASAQTNTSVKAAPGASLSLYITDISLSNGATAGTITLLDGSGGTVVYKIYPAINGGAVMSLRSPIKLTANTALCITSTTVTTHSIFVSGYIAP